MMSIEVRLEVTYYGLSNGNVLTSDELTPFIRNQLYEKA